VLPRRFVAHCEARKDPFRSQRNHSYTAAVELSDVIEPARHLVQALRRVDAKREALHTPPKAGNLASREWAVDAVLVG
jgi:hypothetical protein